MNLSKLSILLFSYFLWGYYCRLRHTLFRYENPLPLKPASRGSHRGDAQALQVLGFLDRTVQSLTGLHVLQYLPQYSFPLNAPLNFHIYIYISWMFYMLILKMSLVLFPSFSYVFSISCTTCTYHRLSLQRASKRVLLKRSTTLMALLKERSTLP